MYYNDIDENVTVFYADVSLIKNHKEINNNRVIVGKMDRKNGLFSIIPVDISSEQILQNTIEVSNNEINKNNSKNVVFLNVFCIMTL